MPVLYGGFVGGDEIMDFFFGGRVFICAAPFSQETSLSLAIPDMPVLQGAFSNERELVSERFPEILLYYPGHLATAVCFTEDVAGDYLLVNGKRYVVCDPTFINANVGRTMTDMDNATAHVILLE